MGVSTTIQRPFHTKISRESTKRIRVKKEAQLAVREFERKLASGYEQSDLSLQDYLDFWINEYKKGSVRKNTLLLHQNNIKNHIIPFLKTCLYEM